MNQSITDDDRRRNSVDKVLSAVSEENRRLWKENDELLKEINSLKARDRRLSQGTLEDFKEIEKLDKEIQALRKENIELNSAIRKNIPAQMQEDIITIRRIKEENEAKWLRERQRYLTMQLDAWNIDIIKLQKEAQKEAEFMAYLKQIADKYGKD